VLLMPNDLQILFTGSANVISGKKIISSTLYHGYSVNSNGVSFPYSGIFYNDKEIQKSRSQLLEKLGMCHNFFWKFVCLSLSIACSMYVAAEVSNTDSNWSADRTIDTRELVQELSNRTVEDTEFSEYENARQNVTTEMYKIMYEISGYFTELERIRMLEAQRDALKAELGLRNEDAEPDDKNTQLETIKRTIKSIKDEIILPELESVTGVKLNNFEDIEASEGIRRILENQVSNMLTNTDDLNTLGSKIAELNNTDSVAQNFKKEISWSFAALVGFVILGFFVIAWKDEKIRKTIFSGDSGIQFLTLFSIVIAIILFGITGVLEGKEISALLGGISGYILGRSSIPVKDDDKTTELIVNTPK
jgi:hypothetical protein